MMKKALKRISHVLAILALAAGMALLIGDEKPGVLLGFRIAAISAAPLLLVGAAFLIHQPVLRPRWTDLLKNVLLASTFLLWGTIQFMPQNTTAARLGNVVIALYVLDLAWVILGSKTSAQTE